MPYLVFKQNCFVGFGFLRADRSATSSLLEADSTPVSAVKRPRGPAGAAFLATLRAATHRPTLLAPVYTASPPRRWPPGPRLGHPGALLLTSQAVVD